MGRPSIRRLDDVRREVPESRAAERLDRARHAPRELGAAAGLHALQLVAAAVELVIADRIKFKAEQVHRIDGRFVEIVSGDERGCADRVARRHGNRVRMTGAKTGERGSEMRRLRRS